MNTDPIPRKCIQVGTCIAVERQDRAANPLGVAYLTSYPEVWYEGELWAGHRLSYHLNTQAIPRTPVSLTQGLVLHTCDNKWCVEPAHLYLGTAHQNRVDMYERTKGIKEVRRAQMKGNENMKGFVHSDEAKELISKANLGRNVSLKHRESIARSNRSRVWTEESKEKVRQSLKKYREQK